MEPEIDLIEMLCEPEKPLAPKSSSAPPNAPTRPSRGRPPGRSIVGEPAQQPTVSPLKLFLLGRFGGYMDKRVKKPTTDAPIRIDDGSAGDAPGLFCDIWITFPDPAAAAFRLHLDKAPYSPDIRRLVKERGGQLVVREPRAIISVPLTMSVKDVAWLRKLGRAMQRIVGPSREGPYDDDNWRWVAPRTAKALRNLAQVLSDYTPLPPQPVAPPAKKAKPPAKRAKPPAIRPEDDLFQILATN